MSRRSATCVCPILVSWVASVLLSGCIYPEYTETSSIAGGMAGHAGKASDFSTAGTANSGGRGAGVAGHGGVGLSATTWGGVGSTSVSGNVAGYGAAGFAGTAPAAGCDGTCVFAVCGDGSREASEGCDDSNRLNGDGCSEYCRVEDGRVCDSSSQCATGLVCDIKNNHVCEEANTCGNGQVESGEGCDDGNAVSNDGCTNRCKLEEFEPCTEDQQCSSELVCDATPGQLRCEMKGTCGNARIDNSSESCDDGNRIDGDDCNQMCYAELGAVCAGDAPCAENGAYCFAPAAGGPGGSSALRRCLLRSAVACTTDGECASSICNDYCGLLSYGDMCTADHECVSSQCDDTSKTCN